MPVLRGGLSLYLLPLLALVFVFSSTGRISSTPCLAFADSTDDEVETISPEDLIAERVQQEEAAAAEEEEDAADFNIVDTLGADLACSACELTVDTLVRNFFSEETTARADAQKKAQEEAEAKEKEVASADADDAGSNDADDSEQEDSSSQDEAGDESSEKGEQKKKDKKKKKKKKKNKKNKKDKKKMPKIKIDSKKVAASVVDGACAPAQFFGASVIGTYPGRRYSSFADSFSTGKGGKLSLDSLNSADSKNAELGKACKNFISGQESWLAAKLAQSSARKGKGLKKLKRDLCEKRNRMCKSAALGFEAESACLAKALRAMSAGEFDKATKFAGNCPASQSA